jgi:predicted XRE-type DNA-binding protein
MTQTKGDSQNKWCGAPRHAGPDGLPLPENDPARLLPISAFYRNKARDDGLSGYCRDCQRAIEKERARRDRLNLLAFLGGKCVQCGESDPDLLDIDHIDACGSEDRPRGPSGVAKAVRANPDEFQLLCVKCHRKKKIANGEHAWLFRQPSWKVASERSLTGWTEERRAEVSEHWRQWWEQHPVELAERNAKISRAKKGRGKFTPTLVKIAADMYESGMSQPDIAKEFGVTQSYISQILSGKRVVDGLVTKARPQGHPNRGSNLTAEEKIEIRRLYRNGMNQYELADKFEVSQGHISRIVREDKEP